MTMMERDLIVRSDLRFELVEGLQPSDKDEIMEGIKEGLGKGDPSCQ